MATRHVPETHDQRMTGHIDYVGAILAGLGLGGTTYALIEAPGKGMEPLVLATAVGGVVALILFIFAEKRSPSPMMPLSIFSSRQFTAADDKDIINTKATARRQDWIEIAQGDANGWSSRWEGTWAREA